MDERLRQARREFLERVAALPQQPPAKVWYTNCGFLSCLAAGDAARGNAILREKVDLCITYTSDCSDFLLNLLIRALLLYPDRITPDNRERIHRAAVVGRYYGGHRRQYPMFYNSENHHMNWAVAELLAAQLFPKETFTFDGRPAEAHYARARFLVANWIDRRGRWGYSEWNSSPYMGINLMSLLNLADFAADPDIRSLATQATTQLLADLAADSLGGGVWGAQARAYEPHVFSAGPQPAAAALMLLLGAGDPSELEVTGGVGEAIATTRYEAPAWLRRMACKPAEGWVNEERHRVESDLFYTCRSAFWRPPFELTNEAGRQQFAPDSLVDVPLRTERGRDYLVSAAIIPKSHPKTDAQALYWMATLGGRHSLFTTQPFVASAPEAAARYWAGTSSVPRCFLKDGVAAAVYEGGKLSEDFTHAHFPAAALDEWTQKGNWFLGRSGDGYAAFLAPEGAMLKTEGPWVGREILAPGARAAWVAVFGSRSRDGGFAGFIRRCTEGLAVEVSEERLAVRVRTGAGAWSVSHADGVEVDGRPFSAADWPTMRNPVVCHEYGAAVTRITSEGGPVETLDFADANRICAEWERAD